jgi:predicted patatin/cPLA2 family phospholipase
VSHRRGNKNTVLIYTSASLRIKRLEKELEDVKKKQSKAIEEARAEAAELTRVKI